MDIRVNVKHMGKRRRSVEPKTYHLLTTPATVRDLILAVVEAGVQEYKERLADQESHKLLQCLTSQEIADKAQTGKIAFGELHGEKKADLKQAQDNAVQCFEDGIYRIFLDDQPLEMLEQQLGEAAQQGIFTFVRLTMLAGRLW